MLISIMTETPGVGQRCVTSATPPEWRDATTGVRVDIGGYVDRVHGIYQHCGEQHLHRHLGKFDFRYSNRLALGINDEGRANIALQGVVGKRLTYETARKG